MNPWDYTLYKSPDGIYVLKVMFSEGEYKIDVGRYFRLTPPVKNLCDGESMAPDMLRRLAEDIRLNYPDIIYPEVEGSAIKFVS